jgi:hypothetical protein
MKADYILPANIKSTFNYENTGRCHRALTKLKGVYQNRWLSGHCPSSEILDIKN